MFVIFHSNFLLSLPRNVNKNRLLKGEKKKLSEIIMLILLNLKRYLAL